MALWLPAKKYLCTKSTKMSEVEFIPSSYTDYPKEAKVGWRSPSNIALVKYWGKKPNQIPANPSISFTLSNCATTTSVTFKKLDEQVADWSFEFLFEGAPKEDFKPKIETFFGRIEKYVPFLKEYHLVIESSNSFPHSSGIASSASGMSALALCIVDFESVIDQTMTSDFLKKKASFLARLGSGSACRSIEGPLVEWGEHKNITGSDDLVGISYPYQIHDIFRKYRDTILLVDKGEKTVSSTAGHSLMEGHPFAENRFKQAHANLNSLKDILQTGDLKRFVELVESEALTLHAVMMTGQPYYILMKPNTLHIIESIWKFRKATGLNLCFTLDAGANVHLLYPDSESEEVKNFIADELSRYCQNGQYINDHVGKGAAKFI